MLNLWCDSSCKLFSLEELMDLQKGGIDDLRFCKLIEWMCNEISTLYGVDVKLHAPTVPENVEYFLLELSSLLSELGKSFFFHLINSNGL